MLHHSKKKKKKKKKTQKAAGSNPKRVDKIECNLTNVRSFPTLIGKVVRNSYMKLMKMKKGFALERIIKSVIKSI